MTAIENYIAPTSLEQAVELLAAGEATILAGGTDLMPQSHAGRVKFKPTLMNIRRIPELKGIALDG
ncbi:MAG: FAD binding domain-containing protein, partial [Pseudomonadota bacterium]